MQPTSSKLGGFNLACESLTLRHQLIDPPMLRAGEFAFALKGLQKSLWFIESLS
jgi:hypothetical protein